MPLYLTNTTAGAINDAAKEQIAADITRIHCEATDAPANFVHAFFVEEAEHMPLGNKSAMLVGTIRAGRNRAQKAQIETQMREAICTHSGFALDDVVVEIRDTPASWVMEGGEIMPEPGEEAAWFAAHGKQMDEAHG